MDVNQVERYIRDAAVARGIDPEIAVRVARSEGLAPNTWQSNYRRGGYREPSYGPFQLLVGGPGTGFPRGMGNDFKRVTGLDPANPENVYQSIDFALDHAAQHGWGAWYGAPKVGISRYQGIGPNARAIGVRGQQQPEAPTALTDFARQGENARSLFSLMSGDDGVPSAPSILDGFNTVASTNLSGVPTPTARPDNPANPAFADNAVGPLAQSAAGSYSPRNVSEFFEGAPADVTARVSPMLGDLSAPAPRTTAQFDDTFGLFSEAPAVAASDTSGTAVPTGYTILDPEPVSPTRSPHQESVYTATTPRARPSAGLTSAPSVTGSLTEAPSITAPGISVYAAPSAPGITSIPATGAPTDLTQPAAIPAVELPMIDEEIPGTPRAKPEREDKKSRRERATLFGDVLVGTALTGTPIGGLAMGALNKYGGVSPTRGMTSLFGNGVRALGRGITGQIGGVPFVSEQSFFETPRGRAVQATRQGGDFFTNYRGATDSASFARAQAEEQRERARSGQQTVADMFGSLFGGGTRGGRDRSGALL